MRIHSLQFLLFVPDHSQKHPETQHRPWTMFRLLFTNYVMLSISLGVMTRSRQAMSRRTWGIVCLGFLKHGEFLCLGTAWWTKIGRENRKIFF